MGQTANVIVRTQRVIVNPSTKHVAVINAGPPGPVGPPGPTGAPGPGDPNEYVKTDGSNPMTGALYVPELWLPTNGEVDAAITAILADLDSKVESSDLPSLLAPYLPLAGGEMSGLLRNPIGVHAGYGSFGLEAGTVMAVRVVATVGTQTGYVAFFPDPTAWDSVGTRGGYAGFVSGNMYVVAEPDAAALDLRSGPSSELYLRRGGVILAKLSGGNYFEAVGPMLCSNGSAPLTITRQGAPTRPFISFNNADTISTRYAAIVGASTSLELTSDSGNIDLIPLTSGGSEVRVFATGMYVGKTASNLAVKGFEIYGSHASAGGSIRSTTTTSSIQNFYGRHESAAHATGQSYCTFAAAGGGTTGSITQNGATGVLFNTSSDGELKGNVQDLDDDEAITRVELWRPVSYQWKFDDEGRVHAEGTPSGEIEHGFIAQEMHKVNPNAVLVGRGTQADHDRWQEAEKKYFEDLAIYEEIVQQAEAIERQRNELVAQWEASCREVEENHTPTQESIAKDSGLSLVTFNAEPVLPDPPELPDSIEIPEPPVDPGVSPYTPWGGDWRALVPDLSAATQALIRRDRAKDELIEKLIERIEILERSNG